MTRYESWICKEIEELRKLGMVLPEQSKLEAIVAENVQEWQQGGLSVSDAATLAIDLGNISAPDKG